MGNNPHILVGTGPLVAFVREREAAHHWAAQTLPNLPVPLLTCEPVLTEVYFLLSQKPDGSRLFTQLLASGLIAVTFSVMREHEALSRLIAKYQDLPMSLADACLVRMAEQTPGSTVLTLDRHFKIYRKNDRQIIPTLMPD